MPNRDKQYKRGDGLYDPYEPQFPPRRREEVASERELPTEPGEKPFSRPETREVEPKPETPVSEELPVKAEIPASEVQPEKAEESEVKATSKELTTEATKIAKKNPYEAMRLLDEATKGEGENE